MPAKNCGENLGFIGADVCAMVAAAEQHLGPAHTMIVERVLVIGARAKDAPTASDAIDLLTQVQETDTVLLFIVGHGFNDGTSCRFLATNAERLGDTFRGTTVVPSYYALQETVDTAKRWRIQFIGTCHSGNAYKPDVHQHGLPTNTIAWRASTKRCWKTPSVAHAGFVYRLHQFLGRRQSANPKSVVVAAVDQVGDATRCIPKRS
jgi:hypothetical protein